MAEKARLIFLGATASIPTAEQDSIYLAVEGPGGGVWLIDCGGSPLHRLLRAGLDPGAVRGVFLTHRHPDHLYGLPYLLQGLWLLGRREPLDLWALPDACETAVRLTELWRWEHFNGFAGIRCHPLNPEEGKPIFENEDFVVTAAPVRHLVPTVAFRIQSKASGDAVVYSGDTEPCDSLVRLARGAGILVHESTGPYSGHSTPRQAGEIARRSGVRRLILGHYNPNFSLEEIVREAAEAFGGPVEVAREGAAYAF